MPKKIDLDKIDKTGVYEHVNLVNFPTCIINAELYNHCWEGDVHFVKTSKGVFKQDKLGNWEKD